MPEKKYTHKDHKKMYAPQEIPFLAYKPFSLMRSSRRWKSTPGKQFEFAVDNKFGRIDIQDCMICLLVNF